MNRLILIVFSLFLLSHLSAQSMFTEVIANTGTDNSGDTYGSSLVDVDNDGDIDLFIANTGGEQSRLFLNNGDFGFVDVTELWGLSGLGYTRTGTWGDFNNDNYLDLFSADRFEDRLFESNGESLNDVSLFSGITDSSNSYSAVWGDYDNDGDLDIFLCNLNGPNVLYQNNNGAFVNVAGDLGVSGSNNTRAAAWGDYDADGDLDLFVANGISGNNQLDQLYRNENGFFVNIAQSVGLTDVSYTLGCAWGDYDNDGDLDLATATTGGQLDRLYQNNNGTFTDVTINAGMFATIGISFSPAWIDYDNDGDLDLHFTKSEGTFDLLYQNNGDQTFSEAHIAEGLILNSGRRIGQAWGDVDGNGFLDVYIPNRFGGNYFFQNNGNGNNWLSIKTQGNNSSNPQGIGANVWVFANGQRQLREISGGDGQSRQNDQAAHFGLGIATIVDSVIVEWPTNPSQRTILTNIAINQQITVQELLVGIPASDLVTDFALLPGYPNPFNPTITIPFSLPRQSQVSIKVYNALGQQIRTLTNAFYSTGRHEVIWDGIDDNGSQVASGIYIVSLKAADQFNASQRIILLK